MALLATGSMRYVQWRSLQGGALHLTPATLSRGRVSKVRSQITDTPLASGFVFLVTVYQAPGHEEKYLLISTLRALYATYAESKKTPSKTECYINSSEALSSRRGARGRWPSFDGQSLTCKYTKHECIIENILCQTIISTHETRARRPRPRRRGRGILASRSLFHSFCSPARYDASSIYS
jgi:hypothetical protein